MNTQTTTPPEPATLSKIIVPAIRNFLIGAVVLGLILCLIAGTFNYWQAWVLDILFMALTMQQGVYLSIKDPELLERRKKLATEGESRQQKIFIYVGLLSTLALFLFSALDHRFGWSQVSPILSLLGDALVALSYYVYYLVFRENSYAASSVKTFEGQKVISTGLYGVVRHPKYVGDLLLVIGIPIALGSWWGLVIIVLTVGVLAWRILDEEKLLLQDLPGYGDYMQKVPYRLVPYVW